MKSSQFTIQSMPRTEAGPLVRGSKLIWALGFMVMLAMSGCALPWQKQIQREGGEMQEEAKQMVTMKITTNDGKTYEYPLEYRENLTAMDLFKWAGVEITAKQYDFGSFVEAIQGVKGEKGYFWIYYVDGTPGNVAADKYLVKPGDVIEWKYEVEKAGL